MTRFESSCCGAPVNAEMVGTDAVNTCCSCGRACKAYAVQMTKAEIREHRELLAIIREPEQYLANRNIKLPPPCNE